MHQAPPGAVDSIGIIYKNENSSTIIDSSKDKDYTPPVLNPSDSILSKKIPIPKEPPGLP